MNLFFNFGSIFFFCKRLRRADATEEKLMNVSQVVKLVALLYLFIYFSLSRYSHFDLLLSD